MMNGDEMKTRVTAGDKMAQLIDKRLSGTKKQNFGTTTPTFSDSYSLC
jgi:hypothetical protein